MSLDDLLLAIAVNDSIQALEGPSAHQVSDTLLLNPESLNLIVDVKEERIVARGIVAGPHQKTSRTSYRD